MALGGVAALWVSGIPNPVPELLAILFWLLANMLGEVLWLPAPRGRGYLSMATAANFASVLILPVPMAVLATALAGVFVDVAFRRRRWYQVLFNFGMCCIAVAIASRVFAALGGVRGDAEELLSPLKVQALALSAVTYFLLNTWLVSGAIALARKQPVRRIWRTTFAFPYALLGSAVLLLLGFFLAVLFLSWGYMSIFAAAIVIYFVRDMYVLYVAEQERRIAV